MNPIYPEIGYLFCNIAEGVKDSDKKPNESNELLVSVIGIGQELLGNIKQIGLSPLQCLREPLSSIEPMTLYHKVGMGTLQMYILSPPRDDKILKEFLNHWSDGKESFSLVRTGSASQKRPDVAIPLSNLMSICCLLVWRPCDLNQVITRILFPGSAPQSRIFEGLNKLEKLDVLSHQVCTESTLRSSDETKEVKKNKLNRYRSVSPVMRSRPVISKQSAETDRNKKLEERKDILSNTYKPKLPKPMSNKRTESNVKTDLNSRKSLSSQKRSVSQSPKKGMSKITKKTDEKQEVTSNETKEIFEDKNYETDEEVLKITLSMNGIENVNELSKPTEDIMEQTVKSLDKDLDLQNKFLTSEYLKDEMEPDSLESVITDGKISKDSLEVSEDESVVDRMAINRDQNREGKEIEESCFEGNQQKDETKGLNKTEEPIESESGIIDKETEDITPKVEVKSQWDITVTNKLTSDNGDQTNDAEHDHSLISVTIGQSDRDIEKSFDDQQVSTKGQILADSVLDQTSGQRDDKELKQNALELGQSSTIEKGLKELEEEKTANSEESNVCVLESEKDILAEGICVEDVSVEEKNVIENKGVNEKPINSSRDGSQMKNQIGEDGEVKTEAISQKDVSEKDQKIILKEEDIKQLEKPINTVTDISDKKNDQFVEVLQVKEKTQIVADNNNAKTEVIEGNAKGIRTTQEDSQVIVSEPTQSRSQDRFETIEKKEEEVKKCDETNEYKTTD